jgi:isocitrate/isopropylmalate dehydrogenase
MKPESIICLMPFRSMAYFRRIFDEISEEFPDVKTARIYVEAAALYLVPLPHQMIIEVALWVWAK